jgi:hypothetical protein
MKTPIERIEFDPSNPEHRKVFREFIKNKRWTMHFKLHSPWIELPAMISERLLLWYMETENAA